MFQLTETHKKVGTWGGGAPDIFINLHNQGLVCRAGNHGPPSCLCNKGMRTTVLPHYHFVEGLFRVDLRFTEESGHGHRWLTLSP